MEDRNDHNCSPNLLVANPVQGCLQNHLLSRSGDHIDWGREQFIFRGTRDDIGFRNNSLRVAVFHTVGSAMLTDRADFCTRESIFRDNRIRKEHLLNVHPLDRLVDCFCLA